MLKIKLIDIKSNHKNTLEALDKTFDEIKFNNTSVSLLNQETNYWLRTSSIERIIIETKNSTYTLERVEEVEEVSNE